MIFNVIVLLFVGFMVYWWSTQGLFSSVIHLVLTVLSALLALAVWEPLVYGVLMGIDYGPLREAAWGIGLLVPFGIILFVLRTIFDQTVPGNLHFTDMTNKIGGGAVGLLSGIITTGMLVIGLQMSGAPSLLGYRAFAMDASGDPQREAAPWVPVDTLTSSFLERLGGGSFSPIGSAPLPRVHPNLAVEASFYAQAAFPESGRAIHPQNISVIENGYYLLPSPPPALQDQIAAAPGDAQQTVIVGTETLLQPADRSGEADSDAIFRITSGQVALVSEGEQGEVDVAHPSGYIQNGQYQSLGIEGDYAYSMASVASTIHHWVFQVPAGYTPRFLRIKQARVGLPAEPIEDAQVAGGLITYTGGPVVSAGNGAASPSNGSRVGPRQGNPAGEVAEFAEVSADLPLTININNLQNVEVTENAIRAGRGRVSLDQGRPGSTLAVREVYHAPSAAIVQVNLGRNNADSLLGQIFNFATRNTQAPVLVDSAGRTYFAIGYGILNSGDFVFSFNPNRTIRALSQVEELGSMSDESELILYYQVPKGITVTEFKLGGAQSQDLNLVVPR